MAKVIKNMGDFAEALTPQVKQTLELVAEDVRKEIDEALQRYYDEYDPQPYDDDEMLTKRYWYHRTEQLLNSCKIGTPKITENTISIEIYLDVDSLNYNTKGADPYKTVVAANAGLHGGFDIDTMEQIPWGFISGNSGQAYGNGTQIWEEPIRELIDKGKLITIFKKYAKQRGLNIK